MYLNKNKNNFGSNKNSEAISQKFTEISSVIDKNAIDARAEHLKVNESILKNVMHEWTSVVEDSAVVNSKETGKIDISRPGIERNAWQIHKEYLSQDNSMVGEMMRIMHAGDGKNPTRENPEDKYKESIARLQQERFNRMHHEQLMSKRRMNNKIKSKGFHRHERRRDMKEYLKKVESGEGNDDKKFKEKLLEFEKIRAQERISLKHKVGGKFAKIQKLRSKYDPNAREALAGMREKGRELTVKRNEEDEDDSSESEGGEEEQEEEEESEISDGNEQEGDEEEEEDEEMVTAGEQGEMRNSKSHKAKTFVEEGTARNAKRTTVSATISTDQSNFLNYDVEESGEIVGSDEARFKEAIYDIYQHDSELAAEFERQKSEQVEKENPKDLQLFKRGWRSWTGEGCEAADKRRMQRGLIKAPDVNRKDKKKTRVWIKQGVHDGLKKHLIKSIPYPYNTAHQFDLSRKELVSSAFNFQSVHREIIKPRFVNNAGQHIYPRQKLEKKLTK